MISTITSKGQITIPVEVRRAAGLTAGTQVEFIVNARQRIELVPRQSDIRALRGSVPRPVLGVGLDAIRAAATQAWVGTDPAAGDGAHASSTYPVRLSPTPPLTRP